MGGCHRMFGYKVGIVCSNNDTINNTFKLLKKMYPHVEEYSMKRKLRSEIKRDLAAREKDVVFITDIKNAEQIEFCDYLMFIPDFSDVVDFSRQNRPRQFSQYNALTVTYDNYEEDDQLILTMNRNVLESKRTFLARQNHLNQTMWTKFATKNTCVLFGEITIKKLSKIFSRINGFTNIDTKKIRKKCDEFKQR